MLEKEDSQKSSLFNTFNKFKLKITPKNKIVVSKIQKAISESLNYAILGFNCYNRPTFENIALLTKKSTDTIMQTIFVMKDIKYQYYDPKYDSLFSIIANNAICFEPPKENNGGTYIYKDYQIYIYRESLYKEVDNQKGVHCTNFNIKEICTDAIELFHKEYGQSLYLEINTSFHNYIVKYNLIKDELYENRFDSRFFDIYVNLKKYEECNVSRSILFYGCPGTGKSTLMKSLSSKFKMRTLRISANDFNSINQEFLKNIIDGGNIKILMVDDIDRVEISAKSLELIDSIKDNLSFLFFSANNKNMNSAFMRMGRIDEIIEINETNKDTIVDILGDDELYEKIRKLPAAYILELKKRIDVLGKEDGYNNFMLEYDRVKDFLKTDDASLKAGNNKT